MANKKDKKEKDNGTRRGNGEGAVSKRKDGTYQASCVVGYKEDGKPKRKYFYGKTKKEALGKMGKLLDKIKQTGSYEEDKNLTLAKWLHTWVYDYMKNTLRQTTWENYETVIRIHIIPAIGGIKLAKLTTNDIQQLYNKKLQGGRGDGKKGPLSLRSVQNIHAILRHGLEQARKQNLILYNPADATVIKRADDKKEISYLETEQVKTFFKVVKDSKHFPAYYLEISTGLRRGELLGLRWKDIDLEAGTVSVNQNLVRTREGLKFQPPKTKNSKRTIGIPDSVVDIIKKHRATQNELKLLLGEFYENNDLAFCNNNGKPYCPRTFSRQFENYIKKAGLKGITLHSLRHSYATLALQEGVDIKTIQDNLGHHHSAFTMNTYSKATNKMKQHATDKMGDLLDSCMQ